MIHHIGLRATDFSKSKAFYARVLEVFGCREMMGEEGAYVGFGKEAPFFWVSQSDEQRPASRSVHVAFSAPDQATVQKFYEVAMAAGGTDNGAPGLRPEYTETYYGAFVLDPDGNNVEAVTFNP